MKSELELRWDGSRRFAKSIVTHIEVSYSASERRNHAAALKVEVIREDLGKVGPVIALQVEEATLHLSSLLAKDITLNRKM